MTTIAIATGKGNFINGEWQPATGKPFDSVDPATNQYVWKGPTTTPPEVELAVHAARDAAGSWGALPVEERIAALKRFRDVLTKEKVLLTETISKETGKPLWDAAGEVGAMIGKVDISIDAHNKRCGEVILEQPNAKVITRHKPHGVVAVLGPFNFPGHLPNGHLIPALLAGNTAVFKPSELTPLVGERMMELWEQAALPKGVINMVQGGHQTGAALAQNPDINALFFTGSYKTGRLLSEMYGKHPEKILALEMGGNNPLIIGEVSNAKAAAWIAIQSAFLSSGQRCSCARRLIVIQGSAGDKVIAELVSMTRSIKVGHYSDTPEPFMGPVISETAAFRLLDAQQSLKARKGKVLIEMRLLKPDTGMVTPGIIDVTDVSERADDEFFGPLLQVIRVPSLAAAIEEANRTHYGLSAGIVSDSRAQYDQVYQQVRAGVINWNMPLTGASSAAPFGGIGFSGNHRPSAYYAADYCSYPTASIEAGAAVLPATFPPGIGVTG